ncbi:PH domain-containing protein [Halocola ammonii]
MSLSNNEKEIREEGATYFQDFVGVGGHMKLTNKRICFSTNASALKQCDLEISLKDISDVTLFKTLSINPNGLTVMLKSGTIENFVVDDRESWRRSILDQIRMTRA